MRRSARASLRSVLLIIAFAGCSNGITSPPITRAPDFEATVVNVAGETIVSPSGAISQTVVWVAIPPATSANAAVIVPESTPVFVQRGTGGATVAAAPDAIATAGHIKVWHDQTTSFGAAEAPPGAPAYSAIQLVVVR